ncbi:coiled-coil domain-containing protein 42 homolog isoform X2 [Convolutriloba macropyga]|uniref:coiled-coil domain-containing protein 42 homolog isoform X2 n=1 Tax=Convolutriloba macropyga TaxID=536237 RepID=UPI003F51D2A8
MATCEAKPSGKSPVKKKEKLKKFSPRRASSVVSQKGGKMAGKGRRRRKGSEESASSQPGEFVFPLGVQICDKKTEMRMMLNQLEQEKAKYEDTFKDLKQQQDQVEREENEFKALVAKHDSTVNTNLEKRRQAKRQAAFESKSKSEKDAQLASLKKEITGLEHKKEQMLEDIEGLQFYHDYMLEVWRVSDGEFDDVADIINRYSRFRDTYQDLEARDIANSEELTKMRSEFAINFERRNTQIVELTNNLNSHQKEIEDLERSSHEWENKLNRLQISSANKNLMLSQIKLAIDNLFYIVNKYIKIKRGGENTVDKLHKIQAFIFDLDEVVQEVPLVVSDSTQLISFFKEKAWHKRGGEDNNFDYIANTPIDPDDVPETTSQVTTATKSKWDKVKALAGVSKKLNQMYEASQDRIPSNPCSPTKNMTAGGPFLPRMDSVKSVWTCKTVASGHSQHSTK